MSAQSNKMNPFFVLIIVVISWAILARYVFKCNTCVGSDMAEVAQSCSGYQGTGGFERLRQPLQSGIFEAFHSTSGSGDCPKEPDCKSCEKPFRGYIRSRDIYPLYMNEWVEPECLGQSNPPYEPQYDYPEPPPQIDTPKKCFC
jgi:hypothetical protein